MDTNDSEIELKPHLDALRLATAGHAAPPAVEAALMAAFAARHPKRRWYQRIGLRWSAAGVGSGAVAALALLLVVHAGRQHDGAPLVTVQNGAAFIALDTLERIESEPSPQLVRTELPRSALAGTGVPVTPENAGERVKADVLMSGEGELLAFRLAAE